MSLKALLPRHSILMGFLHGNQHWLASIGRHNIIIVSFYHFETISGEKAYLNVQYLYSL